MTEVRAVPIAAEPTRVSGLIGETIELSNYIGACFDASIEPRLILDVAEHDDAISAHLSLPQAERLLQLLEQEVGVMRRVARLLSGLDCTP